MLILLKKNLARGGWGGSILMIAIALAFSLSDWVYSFPVKTWYFSLLCCSLMGIVAGIASFGGDLEKDNILFLEYLPVRRSHIWLANYADGLLTLLGAMIALCWYKTIFFHVQEQDLNDALPLFTSRWSFLLGAGSTAWWCASVSIFFCIFCQRGAVSTLLSTMAVLASHHFLGVAVIQWMGLNPSLIEIAPIFWLSGFLFSLASFLIFVTVPSHLPQWKRALFFGLPAGLVIFVAGAAHIYLSCLQWKNLSADEHLSIQRVALPKNQQNQLVIEVFSRRSHNHTLGVDINTGACVDFGRGMELIEPAVFDESISQAGGVSAAKSGRFFFESTRSPNGLFRDRRYLVTVTPDGHDLQRLVEVNMYSPDRQTLRTHDDGFQWSADGAFVVFTRAQNKAKWLMIVDRHGNIRHQVAVNAIYSSFFLSPSDCVLAVAPFKQEPHQSEPAESPSYIVLDLKSGKESRFQLPGRVLRFSSDLKQAVYIRSRVQSDRIFHSISLMDLATREERILFSEAEIPSAFAQGEAAKYALRPSVASPPFVARAWFSEQGKLAILPELQFDDMLERAVGIMREQKGEFFTYSMMGVDVASGRKKVLIPPEEFPRHHITSYASPVHICGFVPGSTRIIYRRGDTIHWMDMTSGERCMMAKLGWEPHTVHSQMQTSDTLRFSPNRLRLYHRRDDSARTGESISSATLKTFEDGEPKVIHSSKQYSLGSFWLDDERIILHDNEAIRMLRADGAGKRQIFPRERR